VFLSPVGIGVSCKFSLKPVLGKCEESADEMLGCEKCGRCRDLQTIGGSGLCVVFMDG
jgi:hypothetical protein